MSTAFHLQTDGATERANRSIAQILCTVVSNDQRDWSDKCPMVGFAINSSVNATTGYTPFENESSNITLELPQEFKDRKINPTFHTNLM